MNILEAIAKARILKACDVFSKSVNNTIAISEIEKLGVNAKELFALDWMVVEREAIITESRFLEIMNRSAGRFSVGDMKYLEDKLDFN